MNARGPYKSVHVVSSFTERKLIRSSEKKLPEAVMLTEFASKGYLRGICMRLSVLRDYTYVIPKQP